MRKAAAAAAAAVLASEAKSVCQHLSVPLRLSYMSQALALSQC